MVMGGCCFRIYTILLADVFVNKIFYLRRNTKDIYCSSCMVLKSSVVFGNTLIARSLFNAFIGPGNFAQLNEKL